MIDHAYDVIGQADEAAVEQVCAHRGDLGLRQDACGTVGRRVVERMWVGEGRVFGATTYVRRGCKP